MVTNEDLEIKFHHAMISIYEKASDACNYKPFRFLQMVQEYGGVKTAKRLISKSEVQSGLEILWESHRLDLSMEALVLKPCFPSLFTAEEKYTAGERLVPCGYQFVDDLSRLN